MKVIELHRSVTESNDKDALKLRNELKEKGIFFSNLMSSAGSGKTTLLLKTIADLKDEYKIAVMEADIEADVDALKIAEAGAKSIQVHTDGMCHMDAGMTRTGLEELEVDDMDLVILENIGYLICPAEFATGAAKNVMILSVPEGDDKPLKYPLMFETSDVLLITKMDTISFFNFDIDKCIERVRRLNKDIEIFAVSAKTGEGMKEWEDWLRNNIRIWKED